MLLIAAFVGYGATGWFGLFISLVATVLPSAAALIILLKILQHFRQSPVVKGMTLLVQPVIAIIMLVLTWDNSEESIDSIGILQFLGIVLISLWLLPKENTSGSTYRYRLCLRRYFLVLMNI
ncbi:Chromate transporter [compost metagenome]